MVGRGRGLDSSSRNLQTVVHSKVRGLAPSIPEHLCLVDLCPWPSHEWQGTGWPPTGTLGTVCVHLPREKESLHHSTDREHWEMDAGLSLPRSSLVEMGFKGGQSLRPTNPVHPVPRLPGLGSRERLCCSWHLIRAVNQKPSICGFTLGT